MTKQEFLKGVDNWSNHRILLWPALEATKHLKLPVLELGCGAGSTLFLRKYCNDERLQLFSFDFEKEWATQYDAIHTDWSDFDNVYQTRHGVVLIDESPGSHRKESLAKVNAEIIVIHDSEPLGWNASDYKVRPLFKNFKYMLDLESNEPGGAWATALSNTIDVTQFSL
jgi:hypothetical protein